MEILNIGQKYWNIFAKKSIWYKLMICLLIVLVCIVLLSIESHKREGFTSKKEQAEKFKVALHPSEIYDKFYANMYDDLILNKMKNDYEIGEITDNMSSEKDDTLVLDIGSGTGHHVASLNNLGYQSIGIDISPEMIKVAKNKYPHSHFEEGDALQGMHFEPSTFTDILCLYFTIYYIKDKQQFFDNCYKWLQPNGTLFLHLVNRKAFDPLFNSANPLSLINLKERKDDGKVKSTAEFEDFKYRSEFTLNKETDEGELSEHILFNKNGKVRQNIHKLYIPTQKEILTLAKEAGFKLEKTLNLGEIAYDNQYIYVLRKQ